MGVFVAGVPSSLARRTPFFSRSPSPSPFTPATQATLYYESRQKPGLKDFLSHLRLHNDIHVHVGKSHIPLLNQVVGGRNVATVYKSLRKEEELTVPNQ